MLKQELSNYEIIEKIDNLFSLYPNTYSREEMIHIYGGFRLGRVHNYVDDILQEVFDELELLEEENNIYNFFIDLLEKNYDINQHIVEVGGGRFSCLAKRIAKRQNSGTVTVYDPKLIYRETSQKNLLTLKKSFDHNTDVTGVGIITGLFPCTATNTIIDVACANGIDFQIALCSCLIRDKRLEYPQIKEAYDHYIIEPARRKVENFGLGNLEVKYLDDYGVNSPIIYTKK